MTQNAERPPLAERLKRALEDGIRHARGEIVLVNTTVPPVRRGVSGPEEPCAPGPNAKR